jgi:hypothetical protein
MEAVGEWFADAWLWLSQINWADTLTFLFINKIARAIGMFGLVLFTIWVIALVYSGYARDSDIGPIAIRAHTNKRLGEGAIVFDQSMYPFQMDGVEATCSVFYQYETREGKVCKVRVLGPKSLKLHIRVSQIPTDEKTHYGFETIDEVAGLPQASVVYPVFDPKAEPEVIPATPTTVKEYVALNRLEEQWTEDDEAPVVSLGPAQIDLISEARKDHIVDKANAWLATQAPGLFNGFNRGKATKDRANVFGSYYLKMVFSKRPDFVLFQHPNRELKMTAWLTLLTSLFAVAMDLWPVERSGPTRTSAQQTEGERSPAPRVPIPRRGP